MMDVLCHYPVCALYLGFSLLGTGRTGGELSEESAGRKGNKAAQRNERLCIFVLTGSVNCLYQ